MVDVAIDSAKIRDAAEILALQKAAYQSEAILYADFAIPPLVETLVELEAAFANSRILKATMDDRIVGSVRGSLINHSCFIGRLIVHPDFQRCGLGSLLVSAIEAEFSHARRFELFTGHQSEGNLRLYAKLGYREVRRQEVHSKLTLIFLEKLNPAYSRKDS